MKKTDWHNPQNRAPRKGKQILICTKNNQLYIAIRRTQQLYRIKNSSIDVLIKFWQYLPNLPRE